MGYLQAFLLGVVQGLTEFLPISSSGHLVIGQKLLGLDQPPVLFDILVHCGTLAAIVIFFNKRLIKFFSLWVNLKLILIASVPVGLVGLILNPYTDYLFNSLNLVAVGLLITGLLLFLTKRLTLLSKNELGFKSALGIGVFQALAILPGVSRSGATISAALLQGIDQEAAFNFSFFLAVPAILAALLLQILQLNQPAIELVPGLIGFITAAIFGYFSLKLLQQVLQKARLHYFAYYCFALGFLILLL
ncbi:undecaprenyl-diphosphate phosphatase [Patescibacteria group bacterium]|nr:undecaprenyl-diphosphate phosphatase [Patescibacteria group bacterium]